MSKLAITGLVVAGLLGGAVLPVASSGSDVHHGAVQQPLGKDKTIKLFITTAVARVHVETSYDLVTPAFRQGMTRRQWATGDIPVVPYFHIALTRWKYAWRKGRERYYSVLLVNTRGEVATFLLGLVHPRRWLICYWMPIGYR
jgi:hypothetical protein